MTTTQEEEAEKVREQWLTKEEIAELRRLKKMMMVVN